MSIRKNTNSKICLLRTSPTSRQQPTRLSPLMLNLPPKIFGERPRRLFNKRDATAASIINTTMAVAARPAVREPLPQTDTFIDAALYIKLKTTLEFILVLVWGEFIQQY